jgi:hypothetical protein
LRHEIFEETNDIDIAFVGSSLMMWGVNTPYVQSELSKRLGRPAVVRSLCWGGTGYDALYFIAQDLLSHRKVRLLVFYDEDNILKNYRNTQAPLWFRFGDNAGDLAGLPVRQQALLYFSAIIGLPRNLLSLVSPPIPMPMTADRPNYMQTMFHTPNPATRLGSVAAELGCTPAADGLPFEPFTPQNGVNPGDVRVYSPAATNAFQFLDAPMPAWQSHFARKFARLAADHGCRLVLLQLPLLDTNRPAAVPEREFWPDFLNRPVTMVGIPPARLFAGLTDADIYRLYANAGHRNNAFNSHFNRNGEEYFTALITPSLLNLFGDTAEP